MLLGETLGRPAVALGDGSGLISVTGEVDSDEGCAVMVPRTGPPPPPPPWAADEVGVRAAVAPAVCVNGGAAGSTRVVESRGSLTT